MTNKKEFKEMIVEDYGTINKSNRTAVLIYEKLVLKYGIPYEHVEIIDDSLIHFYLLDDRNNFIHFHITIEDKNDIEYSIELIEGKSFKIEYFESVNNTINYLDEFVCLCLTGDIFMVFNLEYPKLMSA
jgi:hypothetical protein